MSKLKVTKMKTFNFSLRGELARHHEQSTQEGRHTDYYHQTLLLRRPPTLLSAHTALVPPRKNSGLEALQTLEA